MQFADLEASLSLMKSQVVVFC